MKAILSFSTLVILSYSCNNTAPKTDSATDVDTSKKSNTSALIMKDTVLVASVNKTSPPPPPPPRFIEIQSVVKTDEDVDPPPPNLEFSKIIDSRNFSVGENVSAIGPEDKIYDSPEVRPEFKPADQLTTFISDNLIYPQEALEQGITGVAHISFVVETDGSISNVAILKSSGHALLDYEAKRVIKKMPKWSPGKMNGMAVRCRYTLPIHFELTE